MGDESLKEKSNWGGAREGSGRPEGSKNKATKERQVVEQEMRSRVMKSAGKLLNSQINLALGTQMLFRIDKDEKGNNKKPELVTTQEEIEDYLAGETDNNGSYYFITTAQPDNRALDSLLDRTFGKSVQRTELTGKDGADISTKVEINDSRAQEITKEFEYKIKEEFLNNEQT